MPSFRAQMKYNWNQVRKKMTTVQSGIVQGLGIGYGVLVFIISLVVCLFLLIGCCFVKGKVNKLYV